METTKRQTNMQYFNVCGPITLEKLQNSSIGTLITIINSLTM
jgi:hypothetical protein